MHSNFQCKHIYRCAMVLFVGSLIWTLPVKGQSGGGFNLSWSSSDNGGETFLVGGGFTMGCTSGQADAGPLSGGNYSLYAGFWSAGHSCQPADTVLYDSSGPGTLACAGGDNYGLSCMACIGGGRHGEKCSNTSDCLGGGLCAVNSASCPDSTCDGKLTHAWPKSRYIGVQPNPTTAGIETAIRVKMIDIDGNPNCNDEVRWAGPPAQYCEGAACTTMFWGSQLQSTPHWMDWTTVGVVQLYGEEVIPNSRYTIQMISKQCESSLDNEASYSTPALIVNTAKWGDVIAPLSGFSAATQPAISDVLKLVDKWLGNLEPRKARTQLQPAVFDPTQNVSIADALKGVDAWLGTPYPYSITTCP